MCSLPGFYAPKADLTAPKSDFRFTPESGLKSDISPCPFRAKSRHPSHRPVLARDLRQFGGMPRAAGATPANREMVSLRFGFTAFLALSGHRR